MSIFSIADHIKDVKRDDVDYSTFLMFTYPANMQLSRCVCKECDERSEA